MATYSNKEVLELLATGDKPTEEILEETGFTTLEKLTELRKAIRATILNLRASRKVIISQIKSLKQQQG